MACGSNAERMRRNLESTKGLIFSGQLMLDLAAAGMLREDAYKLVQTHAMQRLGKSGAIFGLPSRQTQQILVLSTG